MPDVPHVPLMCRKPHGKPDWLLSQDADLCEDAASWQTPIWYKFGIRWVQTKICQFLFCLAYTIYTGDGCMMPGRGPRPDRLGPCAPGRGPGAPGRPGPRPAGAPWAPWAPHGVPPWERLSGYGVGPPWGRLWWPVLSLRGPIGLHGGPLAAQLLHRT